MTTSAYATGYGLREFSASALGVAYAGAAATGTHPSTLDFNPALLGDVDDFDVSISSTGILPTTSGTFSATTMVGTPVLGNTAPHGIVNTALVGSISMRMRLTDQITVGLEATTPWGMITDYNTDWVGRYYNEMSNVKAYNITPMVAYQLTPQLTFGAGVQIQYTKGTLGKAIDFGSIGAYYHIPGALPGMMDGSVLLKADDWAVGYILGVEWKATPDLTLGLSYRSKIDHTLGGNEVFTLDSVGIGAYLRSVTGAFTNSTASAAFITPSVTTFGARWQVNDKWTALAGIDWTGWSGFQDLVAHSGNPYQPDDVSVMDWMDSWFGSVGVEYEPIDSLKVRLGTAYDETPTRDRFRTPGIPDSSRYWITGGVGYSVDEHWDADLTVAYLFSSKARIDLRSTDTGNAMRGSLNGTVSMGVALVGVEVTYH